MHHVAIAEEFELRRSSCAKVSQAIAAINYDGLGLVEREFGIVQQMRERQMNRATNCRDTMLMRG